MLFECAGKKQANVMRFPLKAPRVELSVLPAKTPKKSPFKGAGGQILKITGI
jgi:hypothetical protein